MVFIPPPRNKTNSSPSSGFMDSIKSFWETNIRPYICLMAITALGHYIATPILLPTLARFPILAQFGPRAAESLLIAAYAVAGMTICVKLGL